jgi:hypothetical protein
MQCWMKRLLGPLVYSFALAVKAQSLTLNNVPSDTTVQCLLDNPPCVTNVIPFGVTSNHLTGKSAGDTLTLNDADVGSGKEGKVNLANYPNTFAWDADMLALGCGPCVICPGNIPIITGNAHVAQDFDAIAAEYPDGAIFTMPVIDQISGTGVSSIVSFIRVKLLSSSGSGSSWNAVVQLLNVPYPPSVTASGGCGGTTNVVFSETRNLTGCIVTRTWSATDSCGVTVTSNQTIAIYDPTLSEVTCSPTVLTVYTDPGQSFASHVDLGNGFVLTTHCPARLGLTNDAPATFPIGTNFVIWTAINACSPGNIGTQMVIVADLDFRILSITTQSNDVRLTWRSPLGYTGIVQATSGDPSGSGSNSFSDISGPIFSPGSGLITNDYLDTGAVTNVPVRIYRVRLVP